jgi:hypothetical protein
MKEKPDEEFRSHQKLKLICETCIQCRAEMMARRNKEAAEDVEARMRKKLAYLVERERKLSAGLVRTCNSCGLVKDKEEFWSVRTHKYICTCANCQSRAIEAREDAKNLTIEERENKLAERKEMREAEAAELAKGSKRRCSNCHRVFDLDLFVSEAVPGRLLATCSYCRRNRISTIGISELWRDTDGEADDGAGRTDVMPESGIYAAKNGAVVGITKIKESIREEADMRTAHAIRNAPFFVYGGIFTTAIERRQKCSRCGLTLPMNEFFLDKTRLYGKVCRRCRIQIIAQRNTKGESDAKE